MRLTKANPVTYMDIFIGGHNLACLSYTGCDHSMIPHTLVPGAFLSPVDFDVYAANGARVEILGCMIAQFSVQGMPVEAKLLVSKDIQELMLGHDWLAQQGAQWDFRAKTLTLNGVMVPLKTRGGPAGIRRVYARGRLEGYAMKTRVQTRRMRAVSMMSAHDRQSQTTCPDIDVNASCGQVSCAAV